MLPCAPIDPAMRPIESLKMVNVLTLFVLVYTVDEGDDRIGDNLQV